MPVQSYDDALSQQPSNRHSTSYPPQRYIRLDQQWSVLVAAAAAHVEWKLINVEIVNVLSMSAIVLNILFGGCMKNCMKAANQAPNENCLCVCVFVSVPHAFMMICRFHRLTTSFSKIKLFVVVVVMTQIVFSVLIF